MKKLLVVLLTAMMVLSMAGCKKEEGPKAIEELNIAFVPSKDPEEIKSAAEPLKEILKSYLKEAGFEVGTVNITVGSNYEVVGEGLQAGSIDLGFIPAGNYVTVHDAYPDDVKLLLVSSRQALNVDIESESKGADFNDWNKYVPTMGVDEPAGGYRSLFYVNIATEKGKDLYDKAVAGTLTWEDFETANILTGSVTSGASYMYPSVYLDNMFGTGAGKEAKTLANCPLAVKGAGYVENIQALMAGQTDICFGYADVRNSDGAANALADLHTQGFLTEYETVFDCIKVIAVTDMIMNDTISYGSNEKLTPEFVKAIQDAFLALIQTEEGKACVKPYSHEGYVIETDAAYDGYRSVTKLFNN